MKIANKIDTKVNGTLRVPTATGKKVKKSYEDLFENAPEIKVDIDLVDPSPYNHRKFTDPVALQELADNIKTLGFIHLIRVSPLLNGRYRVICGHRRLLAARIAGKKELTVKCLAIPDSLAKEIMLAENIHRDEQHPMDQAFTIGLMLEDKKTSEEIALRLGKSLSFVQSRIKLLSLIEPLQELFFFDKITTKDALLISTFSEESQKDFFEANCQSWKDKQGFLFNDVAIMIRNYQYDLINAPFDTTDTKLVAHAGACAGCRFNSATLTSLFPDQERFSICTNRSCYNSKCKSQFTYLLKSVTREFNPSTLIMTGHVSPNTTAIIESTDETKSLTRLNRSDVTIISAPEKPSKEDFMIPEEDPQNPYFDEQGYQSAVQDYEMNTKEFTEMLENYTVQKGLIITNTQVTNCYFSKGNLRPVKTNNKPTAKQVQQAIKEGKEDADLLRSEIDRLTVNKDSLEKQLPEDTQKEIHSACKEHFSTFSNNRSLTLADTVAARLIIYQCLEGDTLDRVNTILGFPKNVPIEQLNEGLKTLSDVQFAYLIRTTLLNKKDSKQAGNITGFMLQQVAESAGVNISQIKELRQSETNKRIQVIDQRIEYLENKVQEHLKDVA